jgi:hypothetical protein
MKDEATMIGDPRYSAAKSRFAKAGRRMIIGPLACV